MHSLTLRYLLKMASPPPAERFKHCVVPLLQVKKRFLISGGGAAETEVAMQLTQWAKTQTGMRGYCIRAYGEGEKNSNSGRVCSFVGAPAPFEQVHRSLHLFAFHLRSDLMETLARHALPASGMLLLRGENLSAKGVKCLGGQGV